MTKDFTKPVSESQEALLDALRDTLLDEVIENGEVRKHELTDPQARALLATYTEQIEPRLRALLADADKVLGEARHRVVAIRTLTVHGSSSECVNTELLATLDDLRARIAKETR